MSQVIQLDHPLVHHHLAALRNRATPPREFRALVQRLTSLLVYEATLDLAIRPIDVETPLTTTTCRVLSQSIGVVPILRAGLGMVEPVLNAIPDAQVRHLGLQRDEETLMPTSYYQKPPQGSCFDVALILDPMLATGGSAGSAIQTVKNWGARHITLLSLIAAPEGVRHITRNHPDARIVVCAVDAHLNDRGYIVPGLGDAGDRIFQT